MDGHQTKANILLDKSYGFALRIVNAYKHLLSECKEYVLSKQLLRAGTSVGANITEATQAQAKPDFVHKMAVALKEAVETESWLRLLRDGQFLTAGQAESLIVDCKELQRILTSSIKTAKRSK